jgi:hypothetical protein
MSYQCNPHYWTSAVEFHGNSITVCSCIPVGTKVEQNPTKREIRVMWIKDVAAGAGLVLFMVSAFLLASGAHAAMNHLPI